MFRTRCKTKLVSFADGSFSQRKHAFRKMAEEMNFFDDIVINDLSTLPKHFFSTHQRFIEANPRGLGYWIWKPIAVLDALRKSSEHDVIFYCDAGSSLHPSGRERLSEYASITSASKFGILSFSNTHTEHMWTKMDLAQRLNVATDPAVMATSQLTAALFAVRNCESARDLFQMWSQVSVEQAYHFSDDSPSRLSNHPSFKEHRHDQSIGSLIRKIHGTEITHYEAQTYDMHYENKRNILPFSADRLKV